jgi:hypothetical protein
MKNIYNSIFKKLASNEKKTSTAFIGMICDCMSHHHCHKLLFHML